jgi:hypothetical protein
VITSALALVFALPAVAALVVALRYLGSGNERAFLGAGKPS